MSDTATPTEGTPPHMDQPRSRDEAAEQLTGRPLTTEYRPSRTNAMSIWDADGDRFGAYSWRVLHDVERMVAHPDVSQPYSYYKAGIASVKFTVTAQDKEQAKFAHDLLTRVWERHLDQLQFSYDYGWCGYELTYEEDDKGRLDLQQIIDLHPLDCWAVTRKGRYRGLRLKPSGLSSMPSGGILRLQGATDLWGPGKWPARCLWLTHGRRFDRFYGQTQLLGAWRPWMRLAGRDGAEDVLDGGLYRFAYQGPEVRYPPEDFRKKGGGEFDYEAARNEARQMAEQAKAGFSVALPSTYDDKGHPKWEIKWPSSVMSGIGTLLDWEGNLQKQISRGVGVPPELLEASDTGSGYSGRKIPLLGFYEGQRKNARNLVRALVDQVILPLLRWNWGREAWCEVEVDIDVPAAISGEQPEQAGPQGAMPPGAEQGMPPSPDGQDGQPAGPEGMPGLADLLAGGGGGGELSTVSGIDDDPDWLDPGWYPEDDVDYWTAPLDGYELAAPDMSRYQQKQIVRGPRKGQTAWYDSKAKKFMPSNWSPKQQQKAAPATAPKAKAAVAPPAKPPKTPKVATAAAPEPGGSSGGKAKAATPSPAQSPVQQQAQSPAPSTSSAQQPQMSAQMQRIADAAKKDLAAPDHPLAKMRDRLAVANFGSGDVRTIRPTKDAPLSKSDHEAMDRMHSRTAAALKMGGRDAEAAAQLEAAKYHRGLAEKKQPGAGLAEALGAKTQTPAQAPAQVSKWRPDSEVRRFNEGDHKRMLSQQSAFINSMPDEEKKAFNDYSTMMFKAINDVARGRKPSASADQYEMGWYKKAPETMKKMDAAFERVPELKEPTYVHRGINVPPEVAKAMMAGFERAAKSGQAVGFGGYMSTSINPQVAHEFAIGEDKSTPEQESIGIEIKAKKGIYLSHDEDEDGFEPDSPLTDSPEEREFLIPRTAKYRVVGIKEIPFAGGKRRVVQMEQL